MTQQDFIEEKLRVFDEWYAPQVINGFYDKNDVHTLKDFIKEALIQALELNNHTND